MPKFKIEHGHHSERGLLFQQGSVVDSVSDLAAKFNSPGAVKFTAVPADTEAHPGIQMENLHSLPPQEEPLTEHSKPTESIVPDQSEETLKAMTVADIQKFAAEEEIDLSGCKTKEQMIKTIMSVR